MESNGNGKVKHPGRQRGRISQEEWDTVQDFKADLKRELARIEEEEHQRRLALQPPKLYGYIRCSHKDSADSGKGMEAQRNIIKRWAEFIRDEYSHLPEITWVIDKIVSAYKIPFAMREGGISCITP